MNSLAVLVSNIWAHTLLTHTLPRHRSQLLMLHGHRRHPSSLLGWHLSTNHTQKARF
eukprot:COSAG06_NODE_42370_length_382_cov_0.879859_1_plen_56_part_10